MHTTRVLFFPFFTLFLSAQIIEKRHFTITVMIKNDSTHPKSSVCCCCCGDCGWLWSDKSWLEFRSIFAPSFFYCYALCVEFMVRYLHRNKLDPNFRFAKCWLYFAQLSFCTSSSDLMYALSCLRYASNANYKISWKFFKWKHSNNHWQHNENRRQSNKFILLSWWCFIFEAGSLIYE